MNGYAAPTTLTKKVFARLPGKKNAVGKPLRKRFPKPPQRCIISKMSDLLPSLALFRNGLSNCLHTMNSCLPNSTILPTKFSRLSSLRATQGVSHAFVRIWVNGTESIARQMYFFRLHLSQVRMPSVTGAKQLLSLVGLGKQSKFLCYGYVIPAGPL